MPDKQNKRVLILTGDSDSESGIWYSDDNFNSVKPFFVGEQKYRTCNIFFSKNYLLYASDSPLEANCVYLSDSKYVKKIHNLNGPSIFSFSFGENYYFSTSVEGDSRGNKLLSLLTFSIGPGTLSREITLVLGNQNLEFETIFSATKDMYPFGLFQFGNIFFPSNQTMTDSIIFYVIGAKRLDGKTIRITF